MCEALAVPDHADTSDLTKVGDLIEAAVRAGQPVPTVDQVRKLLRLEQSPDSMPTVGEWLTTWLTGRKSIKRNTRRGYDSHLRVT